MDDPEPDGLTGHLELTINLGNAAMQSWSDVRYAVAKASSRIEPGLLYSPYPIRDENGNTVGHISYVR